MRNKRLTRTAAAIVAVSALGVACADDDLDGDDPIENPGDPVDPLAPDPADPLAPGDDDMGG